MSSRKHAPWKDEELLRQKYTDEDLTSRELASEWDCSKSTVLEWLHKFNIDVKTVNETRKGSPWRDEELMKRLYVDEGKSSIDIADEVGCSKPTVLKWLHRHGINVEKENQKRDCAIYTDKKGYETISASINNESKKMPLHRLVAISKYGIDVVKDKHIHHKNKIPWDNRPENLEPLVASEHQRKHANNPDSPWRDKETFVKALEKHDTQRELAKKWGCPQSVISRWKRRHGLRE